jgi:hypothetical protein
VLLLVGFNLTTLTKLKVKSHKYSKKCCKLNANRVRVFVLQFKYSRNLNSTVHFEVNISVLYMDLKRTIKSHYVKLTQVAKNHLSFATAFFFIFLNQIKAQRDHKIIVWIEYFSYKYNFKVISNDECHKSAVANAKWFFAT